jgi:hypothetical protein
MTPIESFAAVAASWQNFYLLCGTAAATLIGLMFVAVTFGANLASADTGAAARAFVDPPFGHFVQVLGTACLLVSPATSARVLSVALVILALARCAYLSKVFGHMRAAHERFHDVELSDWLNGIVTPLTLHLALAAVGVAFRLGWSASFAALGVVTVGILLLGVYGAWELILWMALVRARKQPNREQA